MKRYLHIDFLRAVSIVGVIAIHVYSDNLITPLNMFIWNYLHFVIVAFVFCSGYVMYALYAPRLTSLLSIAGFYEKRLIRLLIPFYWYLLAHYTLLFFFPNFFSGLGLQFSWRYLFQTMTLTGGLGINWLPLLFLQLAILFPLLLLAFRKKRILFWAYIFVAVLFTIGITVWEFPYAYYRQVMWIPWSLFFILPWCFYVQEQKKTSAKAYYFLSVIGLLDFFLLFVIWKHVGRSLTLIDNKYPPNLYYLSYGIFGSFFLLGLSLLPVFKKGFSKTYLFISKVSYNLFFIHFIALDFILVINKHMLHLTVWLQFIFVLGASLGIAWLLLYLNKYLKRAFLQAHNLFLTS